MYGLVGASTPYLRAQTDRHGQLVEDLGHFALPQITIEIVGDWFPHLARSQVGAGRLVEGDEPPHQIQCALTVGHIELEPTAVLRDYTGHVHLHLYIQVMVAWNRRCSVRRALSLAGSTLRYPRSSHRLQQERDDAVDQDVPRRGQAVLVALPGKLEVVDRRPSAQGRNDLARLADRDVGVQLAVHDQQRRGDPSARGSGDSRSADRVAQRDRRTW